jgi:hypothetical protein
LRNEQGNYLFECDGSLRGMTGFEEHLKIGRRYRNILGLTENLWSDIAAIGELLDADSREIG